jgi:hypothetical protein
MRPVMPGKAFLRIILRISRNGVPERLNITGYINVQGQVFMHAAEMFPIAD